MGMPCTMMVTQPPLHSAQPAAVAAAAAAVNQIAAQTKPSDVTSTTTTHDPKRAARPAFSPLMGMAHKQKKPAAPQTLKRPQPALYPGFGPFSLAAAAATVNQLAAKRTPPVPSETVPTSFMAGLATAAAAVHTDKKRTQGVAAQQAAAPSARRMSSAVPTSALGFSVAAAAAAAAAATAPSQVYPWKAFAGAAAAVNKLAAEKTATAEKATAKGSASPPPLPWASGLGFSLSQASREATKASKTSATRTQPPPSDTPLYLRWAGFNPMMSTAAHAHRRAVSAAATPASAMAADGSQLPEGEPPSRACPKEQPQPPPPTPAPKLRALGTQKLAEVRSLSMTGSWNGIASTDSEGAPAA